MFETIRYNLSNLTNFSGRDSRSTFWFYVLFLVIAHMVISFGLSLVAGGAMVVDAFHTAHTGASGMIVQQHLLGGIGGLVRSSMWGSVLLSLVMTVLLAASFTRRLHDSDKPGWVAAATIAMQLLSVVLAIGMINEMGSLFASMKLDDPAATQAVMRAQQAKFVFRGALGWLPTLSVVVFGIWPSSDGDNRHGPEPDHL